LLTGVHSRDWRQALTGIGSQGRAVRAAWMASMGWMPWSRMLTRQERTAVAGEGVEGTGDLAQCIGCRSVPAARQGGVERGLPGGDRVLDGTVGVAEDLADVSLVPAARPPFSPLGMQGWRGRFLYGGLRQCMGVSTLLMMYTVALAVWMLPQMTSALFTS
jgi:hypothetical protein